MKTPELFTKDGRPIPLEQLTYRSDGKLRFPLRAGAVLMFVVGCTLFGVALFGGRLGQNPAADTFAFSFFAAWLWFVGFFAVAGRPPHWLGRLDRRCLNWFEDGSSPVRKPKEAVGWFRGHL